jgi:hypothetical protein
VYDVDDLKYVSDLAKHELIGEHEFTLHKVINSRN